MNSNVGKKKGEYIAVMDLRPSASFNKNLVLPITFLTNGLFGSRVSKISIEIVF